MACRPLRWSRLECVARGYLTGSALAEYRRDRHGLRHQAAGRARGRLAAARAGLHPGHQGTARRARREHHRCPAVASSVGARPGRRAGARSRSRCTARGASWRPSAGIIVADTKIEFGFDADGTLRLADEVLTPDSSQVLARRPVAPGRRQPSFDKQYVRDWLPRRNPAGTATREPPPPLPGRWSSEPGICTSRLTSRSPGCPGAESRLSPGKPGPPVTRCTQSATLRIRRRHGPGGQKRWNTGPA